MGERGESESTKAAYSSLLMRIVLISCAQYGSMHEIYAKNAAAGFFSAAVFSIGCLFYFKCVIPSNASRRRFAAIPPA